MISLNSNLTFPNHPQCGFEKKNIDESNFSKTEEFVNKNFNDLSWKKNYQVYKQLLYKEQPTVTRVTTGTSGCYILSFKIHEKMKGVFKPFSEAADTRSGIPCQEQSIRERLGYVVSQFLTRKMDTHLGIKNFGVPSTLFTSFKEINAFKDKSVGSYQKYKNGIPLQDLDQNALNKISKNEFYKLFLMDVILLNTDRHLGNVFLNENHTLTLIDQGSTFPESGSLTEGVKHDNLYFEWMYLPFTNETLPHEWKDFILKIPTEELYLTLLEEMERLKLSFPDCPTTISANAFFNSIGSLYFLKYWIQTNPSMTIRDYLRCLIAEEMTYVYTEDKNSGRITSLFPQQEGTSMYELQKLANEFDNANEIGKYARLTSKPIFLDFIQNSWSSFCNVLNKSNRRKISPPTLTDVLSQSVLLQNTFNKYASEIVFQSADDLAIEQFLNNS